MAEVYVDIIARINKFQTDLKVVQQQLSQYQKNAEQSNEKTRQQFEMTGRVAQKIGNYIAGIFSIGAIVSFTKQMIAQRSEWEKQVAILKTVTGSYKEAEATMRLLDRLERETIVPLKEISDAYIRLVNKGIKPTYDQMKKMIDLAVSQNRTFGQLAEAIFDASQGATKALRDLGITSKIEGNKIQLTYKGITETVDFTTQAITDFTIKIGGTQGVMGASAEVAETLSGKLFVLKDSWEDLLRVMGERSEGVFVKVIEGFTKIVEAIGDLHYSPMTGAINDFEKFKETIKDLDKEAKAEAIVKYIEKLRSQLPDIGKQITELEDKIKSPWLTLSNQAILANNALMNQKQGLTDLRDSYQKLIPMLTQYLNETWASTDAVENENDELKIQARTINVVNAELAKWKEKLGDLSGKELAEANLAIYNLNEELKKLQNFGLETPDVVIEKIEKIADAIVTSTKAIYPDPTELKEQKAEEIIIDEETWQAKLENAQKYFDTVAYLIDGLAAINTLAMNNELQRAEGNEKKQEEIRRKYAKKEQSMAVARTLISGAEGIVKTGANLGYPVAIPFQILQGIETAIQIALIRAQRFATGILNLQGRGTGTSDSIPSMLSRGESVMTAKETQEYYPYLKAMKEGKFPKLQLELMNDFAKMKQITNNNLNYDNSREIQKLEQIRTILNKERGEVYIEGKYKIIKRNGITTKISLN